MNKNKSWIIWTLVGCLMLAAIAVASTRIDSNGITTDQLNVDNWEVSNISNILYVQPGNASDIQAKINRCPDNGCKVILPCGQYETSSSITPISNMVLSGTGKHCTFIKLADSSDAPLLNIENKHNITIEGLYLDHNGDNQGGDQHNLRVISSNNITIKDNTVVNAYHHNINAHGNDIRIMNNDVSGHGIGSVDGVGIIVDGINNYVSYNTVVDTDFGGIEVYPNSNNSIISNNLIYWTGSNGNLGAISVLAGSHNTIINSNIIQGEKTNSGGSGIKLTSAVNTIITNNQIRNLNESSGQSIWISGGNGTMINNNIISGGHYGLYIEGDNNIISGNQLVDNNDTSIYVRSSANNTLLLGNFVLRGNAEALRLTTDNLIAAVGNIVTYRNGKGVLVENSDNVLLNSNYLAYNSDYAIRLQTTNHTIVNGNFLKYNTNGAIQQVSVGLDINISNNLE